MATEMEVKRAKHTLEMMANCQVAAEAEFKRAEKTLSRCRNSTRYAVMCLDKLEGRSGRVQ